MFGRSESSVSFHKLGANETQQNCLAQDIEIKPRHYSVGCLYDQEMTQDPFFKRMSPIYKSIKSAFPAKVIGSEFKDIDATVPIEIDAGEPPPVDESLFFDNLEAFRRIKIDGANLMTTIWSALSVTQMKMLLQMEKSNVSESKKLLSNSNENFKNIALLWACFRDLVHLLPVIESTGVNVHLIEPSTGVNAIMVACLSNNISCLEYLISKGVDVNHTSSINNYTCLHVAAIANSREATELLLKNGAKLHFLNNHDVEPILHCAIKAQSESIVEHLLERGISLAQKNRLGETPLHVACFVQSISCAEMLLCTLGTDVNAVDRMHRTPLHYAVMNTSSSAELVELLQKHGAQINVFDKTSFSPLHIAALNELSHCVEILIWAGADVSATTNSGLSALNIILRKIPESLQVFRRRLDASIKLKRPVPHNREFEMRMEFDLLFPSNNHCETSFINTFVQEHRKDLLSHPLVMAFLHLKWEKIRKIYLLRIFHYALAVMFMTTYVLTALAYKCYNVKEASSSKICNSKRLSSFLFRRRVIEIEWYLSLILTCVTIPRKIMGFTVYKSIKQYFSNIENILDAIVVVSVFITSFVYTGKTYNWQNYIGAFAILCAWTNLMLMVGQLPAFGTYVAMFTHIQFEFAKLLLAYSGLLIGFTISFCVIFVEELSFGNPFTGLIKVLAMMAGELDFEGLINQTDLMTDGSFVIYHPLSVCSQILFTLFTLFIVFVTVILMNLLVGIAVHDIQGLRNHAGLTKLVRQTKLILFTEMVLQNGTLPYFFRKWMSDHKIDVENRKRVLVVKPLNPLEKRLPKDILKAAYEIAQQNIPLVGKDNIGLCEYMTWINQQGEEGSYSEVQLAVERLSLQMKSSESEIQFIKD